MDADVVTQLMISQQLLSEDAVLVAQSSYHKNCLILQQVRLMDAKAVISFCQLLKAKEMIEETLINGEKIKAYYVFFSKIYPIYL